MNTRTNRSREIKKRNLKINLSERRNTLGATSKRRGSITLYNKPLSLRNKNPNKQLRTQKSLETEIVQKQIRIKILREENKRLSRMTEQKERTVEKNSDSDFKMIVHYQKSIKQAEEHIQSIQEKAKNIQETCKNLQNELEILSKDKDQCPDNIDNNNTHSEKLMKKLSVTKKSKSSNAGKFKNKLKHLEQELVQNKRTETRLHSEILTNKQKQRMMHLQKQDLQLGVFSHESPEPPIDFIYKPSVNHMYK